MTSAKAAPQDHAAAQDAGRNAASPWSMPLAAWKSVAVRTWRESSDDNMGLIAAGVAFYGFLAIAPILAATVLIYGLFAEVETVLANIRTMAAIMPADVATVIGEQLLQVVQTSNGKKGLGLLLAIAVALFGARNAAGALVTALNIIYEEKEKRGFIRVTLLALAITCAAIAIILLAALAIAALGFLHHLFPSTNPVILGLSKAFSYALLALVAAAAAATLYRFGPSRDRAKWVWLTPGSAFFAVGWVILTLGFGFYVANFGNYGATYGSLGAVVVLLTWLYLSSYVLLFGAELNSELEHQTAQDTTHGRDKPLGERGAWVADHVAGEDDAGGKDKASPTPPRG